MRSSTGAPFAATVWSMPRSAASPTAVSTDLAAAARSTARSRGPAGGRARRGDGRSAAPRGSSGLGGGVVPARREVDPRLAGRSPEGVVGLTRPALGRGEVLLVQGDQEPRPGQPPAAAGTVELALDELVELVQQRAGGREVTGVQPQLDQLETSEHGNVGAGVRRPGGQVLEGDLCSSGVTELACGDRLGDAGARFAGCARRSARRGGSLRRRPATSRAGARRARDPPRVPPRGRGRGTRPRAAAGRPVTLLPSGPTARRGRPRGLPGSSRTDRPRRPAARR